MVYITVFSFSIEKVWKTFFLKMCGKPAHQCDNFVCGCSNSQNVS